MLASLLTLSAAVVLIFGVGYLFAVARRFIHLRYRLWSSGRCATARCGRAREWMSFCGTCRSRMPATERREIEEAARAAAALERRAHEELAATYASDIERLVPADA